MTSFRNVALVSFCAIGGAFAQVPSPSPEKSVVYTVHDANAIASYKTNPRVVRAMVDRIILAATGQPDLARAWGSLIAPNDKIGIKISAAGGELFTTHHDVVTAIVDGLVAAGHPRSSIVVWDRSLEGTKGAGYKKADGFDLKAIAPLNGYDPKATLTAPLLGKLVWGDVDYISDRGKSEPLSDTENTSSVSHFSRIISSEVTKIINVPVMSNSTTNGIAGCLYNMTVPNIDNWRRFAQGTGFGAESVAIIYANPVISQKVVLNVMDGLAAQYAGGPQSQPNFALHHATLYASKDPVALDTVALKRLDEWRSKANFQPIGRLASYVQTATTVGLGNSDMSRIEVKNAGR
ncbi:MAG TPA: DUF362 domain-containing protein [Chthoniobacterales bacterium]|nr:DUF362 domain-containing protein [Chthoniobacterales bacterium]